MVSAEELLGPTGPLARSLPGYEARPAQLCMANAVERALLSDRILFCEAGTGTGKSLAYLVPAILSGKKVVVSTATRALQEQIFFKDLPLIERALGLRPEAVLMKGLSNYLCRRRYVEWRAAVGSFEPRKVRALALLEGWVQRSEAGDLGEVEGLAEDDPVLSEVSSSSDTRVGAGCAHFAECFVTRMRREAEAARLVIVNHHLFFADLSLRGPHPGRVIPDYDAVVFDEAHQLEDVASDFFGIRLSRGATERLLRDAERALAGSTAAGLLGASGRPLLEAARKSSEDLWRELLRLAGRDEARVALEPDAWSGELQQRYLALDASFEGLSAALASARGALGTTLTPAELARARGLDDALRVGEQRLLSFRDRFADLVQGAPGRVVWLDAAAGVLSATPVDLSSMFRTRVFESIPAVVLTSATLAGPVRTAGPERSGAGAAFDYVRSRLGVADDNVQVDELLLDSPFDFANKALLYTPKDLPRPDSAEFLPQAEQRIAELIALTGGGCFVLTTSLRAMRTLHAALKARLGAERVLVQGSRPKSTLIAEFRAAGDAVLVATASFWEGVDVPGHALRLVVLDKIPFLVPSDPLVRARSLALEEAGENPFLKLHVPAAAIALKQGFGRLIRSREDRGIVALLDSRVHQKGYGPRLLASLPPARRASDLEAVRSFWLGTRPPALAH